MARVFLNKNNRATSKSGVPIMKMELFGQWDESIRLFQKLGPAVKVASLLAQMKVCNQVAKVVKSHLRNQDLGWTALSEQYADKKEQAGLSGDTLMAYKVYYENIEAWTEGTRSFAFAGVRRGIYTQELNGQRSKMDIATIAAVHEFSTGSKIPRRPLWNPSIEELGNSRGLKQMYINSLVWYLRKAKIPVETYSTFTNGFK